MSVRRRMERLEEHLTPQEAVIQWMKESHDFGSILTYYGWLREQPQEAWPLVRLPRRVAAGKSTRGRPLEEAARASETALKTVVFLFSLHQVINLEVARREEDLRARVLQLLATLRVLTHDQLARDGRRREGLLLPGVTSTDAEAEERYRQLKSRTSEGIGRARIEALGLAQTVDLISQRYLQGEDVLFPDLRSRLRLLLQTLEQVETVHQELLRSEPPESAALFRRSLLYEALGEKAAATKSRPASPAPRAPVRAAGEGARLQAEKLVLLAQAETLNLLGQTTRSRMLLASYLDSELAPNRCSPAATKKRKALP